MDWEKIDLECVEQNGRTVFTLCFQRYLDAVNRLKMPRSKCSKLVSGAEEVFFFLLDKCERRKLKTDQILAIPSKTGLTCFLTASNKSEKITEYLLGRNIKFKSIDTKFMIPQFKFNNLAVKMMQKGINPNVIDYTGYSRAEINPSSFRTEESKNCLSRFSRSIHYSIKDIICYDDCSEDCISQFDRFQFKEGSLIRMTEAKQIGQGGFGMVYEIKFHGKRMAAKCIEIGRHKERVKVEDTTADLEINIAEYTIQLATPGSGVILPNAILRQQDQEKNEHGKWVARNFNILIYPKYDCNLYQLHENYYDKFTDQIIIDIMLQCLTRKSSSFFHF